MNTFVLKKGTIVGHGTSLSRLPSILEQGLIVKAKRAEGRMTTELAPETAGVYAVSYTHLTLPTKRIV